MLGLATPCFSHRSSAKFRFAVLHLATFICSFPSDTKLLLLDLSLYAITHAVVLRTRHKGSAIDCVLPVLCHLKGSRKTVSATLRPVLKPLSCTY